MSMYIALTIVVLTLLTVAMLLLRIFWNGGPSRLRFGLTVLSISLILVQGFFAATRWATISDRVNVFIFWLAVAGYEFLIFSFSRLSPKWLTSLSAAILLIPIFASSIVMPLAELFDPTSYKTVSVGNHLCYQVRPWGVSGGGNTGADLIVSRRPLLAPFLRHKVRIIPFNDRECNSSAAFAVPFPSTKTVLGRCPRWPSGSEGTVDKLFPLS